MKPIIINISGKAQHGKDTFAQFLADYLYEDYGHNVQIIHFADALKEYCRELGWNGEKDNNGRVLLQFVGTEWGRECVDKDIWVKKAEEKIYSQTDIVLIPDTRFPNEIEYWSDNGYKNYTVKVVRLNEDGSVYGGLEGKQAEHDSETALEGYEFDYEYKAKTVDEVECNAIAFAVEVAGWRK